MQSMDLPLQGPQDGVDLYGAGLAAWRRMGQLLAPRLTVLLPFARRRAMGEEAVALALRARVHPCSPPARGSDSPPEASHRQPMETPLRACNPHNCQERLQPHALVTLIVPR